MNGRRAVVLALATAAGACGGGDAEEAPVVVDVEAQPCETPNRRRGRGVVIDDGLVVTAAHTVEGSLRALIVDDVPAEVAVLDARTDLAVLSAPPIEGSSEVAPGSPPATGIVDGVDVRITRTGPLVVHDATDGVSHERQVHRFEPGVAAGTSGAPLVDDDGRVLGIVVLDRGEGGAYAVTAAEVAALVRSTSEASALPHAPGCSG